MKSFFSIFLLAAAALAVPTTPSTENADTATTSARYIIILNDSVEDVSSHLAGLHLPNAAMYTYEGAIKGFVGEFNAASLALIHADPMVEVVEIDQEMQGFTEERFSGYGLAISSQPFQLVSTNQNSYFYDHNGAGVIVYVLDSGIQASNPDFGGRAVNAQNFVTRQYGFADEPNTDTHGHGTAVSGCVGGSDWGISKGVTIRGLKVLDFNNRGHTSATTAAINYAINDCNGAKCVINLSLGGPQNSATDYAVSVANRNGLTVVAAAGNDNINACNVSPAGSPAVITVAANDNMYNRADFSNFGPCVDLFAPGVDIRTDSYTYPRPTSILINGTSFSAPYVSGIAAYFLSAGLNTPNDVKAALRQFAMRGQIGDTAGSPNLLANNGYFNGVSK